MMVMYFRVMVTVPPVPPVPPEPPVPPVPPAVHPDPLPTKFRVALLLRLLKNLLTVGAKAQLVRVGRTEYDPEASPPKL